VNNKKPSAALIPMRLLTVLVVYEHTLDNVRSWAFLSRFLRQETAESNCVVDVLIYDNSLKQKAKPPLDLERCVYIHDPQNGGTAAAYTYACNLAAEKGIDWLLLLDQDTELPTAFFDLAQHALWESKRQPCALVPWISHGSRPVSPAYVSRYGSIIPVSSLCELRSNTHTAISSGSILYVPTIKELLPFPEKLWLDYVDHWIFLRLREYDQPIVIFDGHLEHNLSVFDIGSLSSRRLISILDGESLFIRLLGFRAQTMYPVRLAIRLFRYLTRRPRLAKVMVTWFIQKVGRHNL
jgi:hypothetical protein